MLLPAANVSQAAVWWEEASCFVFIQNCRPFDFAFASFFGNQDLPRLLLSVALRPKPSIASGEGIAPIDFGLARPWHLPARGSAAQRHKEMQIMLSTLQSEYGLEVTHNSKAGYAFSLPRSKTCIYKTDACAKACYGNGIRYQSDGQKRKRARNFKTVEFLLDRGGPALLAENLVILIDQARPIDWIASSITGIKTAVPWSLRLHDIGDVHSARYAQAWLLAVRQRPQCSLWFYTRSFPDDEIFEILTSLAAEPNCKGWLSLDRDNYSEGIIRYCEAPSGIWSIALLQEKEELMPSEVIPYLTCFTRAGDLLSFPKHHAGRHVTPMNANNLVVCPQIIGSYKLEPAPNVAKPCQSCGHCLP